MSKKAGKDKAAPQAGPEEGADTAAPAAKKKPSLKMLLIAGAGALVVLGGGGTGAALLMGGKGKAEAAGDKVKKPEKKKAAKEADKGGKGAPSPITQGPDGVVFYTLPDQVVNIQSADGRPTFLKLKLAFELPDEGVADVIEPNQPRLTDMFQTFLRELRPEDLSGSQGSYQLRMEILRRVNLVIAPSKVNAVLVQEMLIQ